ncbi:uncharacterized protein [Pyrus communis]|uniref:uncharacterized protein n=1 Tax=Pyrus communis TaxID=23211 RepID=UPI0035C11B1F
MVEEDLVNIEGDISHTSPSNFSDVKVNTNQLFCSVLLNEFNYLPWSRAVSLALGGKGKLGFVNGSVEAPDISSSTYVAWLCKDQLVMSLLLNTMEKHVAKIFSYYNSSCELWKALQDMYGNQNNYARVFQLKKDIANAQQEGKAFVQHLGCLKAMWNELDVYLPLTTDPAILLKQAEEDIIYQLLGSLNSKYEDLRSHVLMSQEFPTFNNVCATIQREEVRKKVMNAKHKSRLTETRAYASNYKISEAKVYKDKCWELHPELKPKFSKDAKMIPRSSQQFQPQYKAQLANAHPSIVSQGSMEFTANPFSLINEFAAYLQSEGQGGGSQAQGNEEKNHAAMLGQFFGFLNGNEKVSQDEAPGILKAFTTALLTSQGEELFEMFPLPPIINNPMLEESLVAMTPDIEEIQTDSISNHRIPTNKGDEESHFDHSQSPTESQGLRRNHSRTRKPPTMLLMPHGILSVKVSALEKKAVGSRWIYKIKFKADGSIKRHKARLVDRGFTQTFGVDYKETFAPMSQMNSMQVLLSVAINCGWTLYQMDVKNAFLHEELQEKVYMQCPPGLEKAGFLRSNADSILFVRTGTSGKFVVLIYVDDLIIIGDSVTEIEALKLSLRQTFAIKDLGKLKVLRYLKGSIGQGIIMRNNSTAISGYTDADWAGNALDRKSTTGYCMFVGGNLVTWKSKKQHVIARSSAKAECQAMTATACELMWPKGLLSNLGCTSTTPMSL